MIHRETHKPIRTITAVTALTLVLSACNTVMPEVEADSAPRFEQVMSIDIEPNETAATLEARAGGKVVSWQPEAGYAIVGLDQATALELQNTGLDPADPNKDAVKLLETRATANAVGWSAWGSGWSAWGSGQATSLTPTENSALWAKIQLAEAHRLAPKWGAGIKVAVIDTGIDLNHPAFRNRLVPASEMWDWVGNDATPQEVQGEGYGHGTIVAGIIAQVAQNARIMPLRVLAPNGAGDTVSVIAAVDWAVAKGAKIINLSLGADTLKSLQKAIENATSRGVLVVASSGNTGDKTVTFPARAFRGGSWAELTVGVGSTDRNDRRSRFSTFGKELEMVAPGEQIYGPAPDNRVAAWSGTSMAAPVVSGGLALALGERTYSKLSDVGQAIVDTSDDIQAANPGAGKDDFGKGRLNLKTFLQTVLALK